MEITELQVKKIIKDMARVRRFDIVLEVNNIMDTIIDIYQIPKDDHPDDPYLLREITEGRSYYKEYKDKYPYSFSRDWVNNFFEETLQGNHTVDELINYLKSTANKTQHIYINQLVEEVKDAE